MKLFLCQVEVHYKIDVLHCFDSVWKKFEIDRNKDNAVAERTSENFHFSAHNIYAQIPLNWLVILES